MITENDYTLVENANNPMQAVKFKTGKYKDVIVMYGTVSVKESPELDMASLGFTFQIIEPAEFAVNDLENDEEFKNYMGEVLQYIITDSLDYAKENNVGVIGIGNDESTADSHTQSST